MKIKREAVCKSSSVNDKHDLDTTISEFTATSRRCRDRTLLVVCDRFILNINDGLKEVVFLSLLMR